jgi:hypothetical protein
MNTTLPWSASAWDLLGPALSDITAPSQTDTAVSINSTSRPRLTDTAVEFPEYLDAPFPFETIH